MQERTSLRVASTVCSFAPDRFPERTLAFPWRFPPSLGLGFDNLLRNAFALLKRPKRYYLTYRWRLVMWAAFSAMFVILAAKRTIRVSDLWKLLLVAPRMLLGDGSLSAIGFLVNLIAFSTFSRGERRRFSNCAVRASAHVDGRCPSKIAITAGLNAS